MSTTPSVMVKGKAKTGSKTGQILFGKRGAKRKRVSELKAIPEEAWRAYLRQLRQREVAWLRR